MLLFELLVRDTGAYANERVVKMFESSNTAYTATVKGLLPGEVQEYYSANKKTAERLINEPDKLDEALCRIEEKLRELPKFGNVLAMIPVLVMMVRSYVRGEYTAIPAGTIVSVVAALLYFLAPVDAVPDFIPGTGFADDAALLAFCLKQVMDDVDLYKDWRNKTKWQSARYSDVSGEPQYVKATVLDD